MTSEAMVRHLIGVEGAGVMLEVVKGAWQDYVNEERERYHRSTRAAILWDYMAGRSEAALLDMDGVAKLERNERPLFLIRNSFTMRPKMHDRQSLTRNYPTEAQRNLSQSGMLPEYEYSHVTFGYKLDAAEADLEQILITSPSDDDDWVIDLQELANGELRPIQPMFGATDDSHRWRNIEPIRRRRAS